MIQVKASESPQMGFNEAVTAIENIRFETIRLSTVAKIALAVGINLIHLDWFQQGIVELVRPTLANALNELMDHLESLVGLPEEMSDRLLNNYLKSFTPALKEYFASLSERKKQKGSHFLSRFLLGYFACLQEVEMKIPQDIPHIDTSIVENPHYLRSHIGTETGCFRQMRTLLSF